MRGVVFLLVGLILSSYVFAMDEPIVVKADPGQKIKLYAWTAGGGPLLNLAEGVADESGVFSATFFSLNVEEVRYQVMVIDSSDKKVYDTKFNGFGTDEPLDVDCTSGSDCIMSVASSDVIVSNLTEDIADDFISEDASVLSEEKNSVEKSVTESVYFEKDGSTFSFYLIIGGLLTFVVLMLAWFKFHTFRDFLTRINYFSEDGELARLEAEIKRKDDLIDRIKEKEAREKKIALARKKLEKESKKLENEIKKKMKK